MPELHTHYHSEEVRLAHICGPDCALHGTQAAEFTASLFEIPENTSPTDTIPTYEHHIHDLGKHSHEADEIQHTCGPNCALHGKQATDFTESLFADFFASVPELETLIAKDDIHRTANDVHRIVTTELSTTKVAEDAAHTSAIVQQTEALLDTKQELRQEHDSTLPPPHLETLGQTLANKLSNRQTLQKHAVTRKTLNVIPELKMPLKAEGKLITSTDNSEPLQQRPVKEIMPLAFHEEHTTPVEMMVVTEKNVLDNNIPTTNAEIMETADLTNSTMTWEKTGEQAFQEMQHTTISRETAASENINNQENKIENTYFNKESDNKENYIERADILDESAFYVPELASYIGAEASTCLDSPGISKQLEIAAREDTTTSDAHVQTIIEHIRENYTKEKLPENIKDLEKLHFVRDLSLSTRQLEQLLIPYRTQDLQKLYELLFSYIQLKSTDYQQEFFALTALPKIVSNNQHTFQNRLINALRKLRLQMA